MKPSIFILALISIASCEKQTIEIAAESSKNIRQKEVVETHRAVKEKNVLEGQHASISTPKSELLIPTLGYTKIDIQTATIHIGFNCYRGQTLEQMKMEIEQQVIAGYQLSDHFYPKSIACNFNDGTSVERSSRPDRMTSVVQLSGEWKRYFPSTTLILNVGIKKDGTYYCDWQ